jgi:hypothetical protein
MMMSDFIVQQIHVLFWLMIALQHMDVMLVFLYELALYV